MSVRTVLVLASALAAWNAFAQPYPTPPTPGAPRAPAIAAPQEKTLANGLRVIVAQRSGMPLVSTQLVILSGGEADPADRAGLADFTANLLVKGTKKRSAPRIAQDAESLGGSLDTGAGWHRASVSITVTTPRVPAALELLADVAMNPVFAPAEIERVRKQTLDVLRVAMSEPGSVAGFAAARAVFGAGTYGHPLSGSPASVSRIRRADMVAHHRTWFRPDNALLVFAGDIDLDRAVALANASFGGWAKGKAALPSVPAAEGRPLPAPVLVIDMPDADQSGVVLSMPGVERRAPDYYAGLIANTVLGGGYSSRINQEIRIKRGLSYGAGSRLEARRAGGQMSVAAQTKNVSAPEVLTLMSSELDKMISAPPDSDELTARRTHLIGEFSRGLETTAGLNGQTASLAVNGVPLDELPKIIQRMEAVSPKDVQSFAAAHWGADGRRAVIGGRAADFAEVLDKSYPKADKVALDALDFDRTDLKRPAKH
jgi:zinc protease